MLKKLLLISVVLCLMFCFAANASAAGRLFHTNEPLGTIEELNPDTGGVINSFVTPIAIGDGCSGLGFANNRLFFSNCDSAIYELDPANGAVVNSFASPSFMDALGFSGSELFVLDFEADIIYVVNPSNGSAIRTLNLAVDAVGGLTYAGGRNSLFVSNAESGTVYEINASNGSVVNSFAAPVTDIYGLGYSFARKTLFAGDVGGGMTTIYEVNADTGAVINSLPVSPNWSLAADENGAAAVPTMTEWGMIIFMMLAGLASLYRLRRRTTVN
jgi:outer membrane protein assembly factor BamB